VKNNAVYIIIVFYCIYMELSIEQNYAINLFENGENIALMGPAGTGKSFVVKQMIEIAKKTEKTIAVTAMTGVLGNGAKTIHGWSGMGIPRGSKEDTVDRFYKYPKKNEKYIVNWETTNILIVDEISMMSRYVFELLDQFGKSIRNNTRPFGGLQLVFIGDFHQLPPIADKNCPNSGDYCFESPLWKQTFPIDNHVILKKIFRQNDPLFQSILTALRGDKEFTKEHYDALYQCTKKQYNEDLYDGCYLTKIVAKRVQCEQINNANFQSLSTPIYSFELDEYTSYEKYVTVNEKGEQMPIPHDVLTMCWKLSVKAKEEELKILKKTLPTTEPFIVRKDACVMCTANLDLEKGICNGAIGTVLAVSVNSVLVKFANGVTTTITRKYWQSDDYPTIVVSYIPLILAWAITIHKSQGATLPMAEIDAGDSIFAEGQTYVALSRVKSLDGLYLKTFNPNRIRINPKVKQFYDNIPEIEFEYDIEEEYESEKDEEVAETISEDNNTKRILMDSIWEPKTINFERFAYKEDITTNDVKTIKI
jgi:ATP-dependent DNA helicase PIF1